MKNKEMFSGFDYENKQAELILSSFYRVTGRHLIDPCLPGENRYHKLFDASFCVVSHNTNTDPVFNYGNRVALDLFEMTWEDFTKLPSKLSAEPQIREEREQLLSRVAERGYVDDYKGVRVSSTGRRFMVENAVVWNLIDNHGQHHGQAAVLYSWTEL